MDSLNKVDEILLETLQRFLSNTLIYCVSIQFHKPQLKSNLPSLWFIIHYSDLLVIFLFLFFVQINSKFSAKAVLSQQNVFKSRPNK